MEGFVIWFVTSRDTSLCASGMGFTWRTDNCHSSVYRRHFSQTLHSFVCIFQKSISLTCHMSAPLMRGGGCEWTRQCTFRFSEPYTQTRTELRLFKCIKNPGWSTKCDKPFIGCVDLILSITYHDLSCYLSLHLGGCMQSKTEFNSFSKWDLYSIKWFSFS